MFGKTMLSNPFAHSLAGMHSSPPALPSFGLTLIAVTGAALAHATIYIGLHLYAIRSAVRSEQTLATVFPALALGAGLAVFLLPKAVAFLRHHADEPPLRRIVAFLPLAAIFALAIALRLPGIPAWEGNVQRLCLGCMAHGIIAIGVAMVFFAAIPQGWRGLLYGICLSLGFLCWDIVQELTWNVRDEAAAETWYNLLWNIQDAILLFQAVAVVCGFGALRPAHQPPAVFPSKPGRIYWLMGTFFLFYLANGFMHAQFFCAWTSQKSEPDFWQLHLLIIVTCPLFGLFLDRWRDGLKTLILSCSVLLLLAPTLRVLNDSPLLYPMLLSVITLAQYAMLTSATVALAGQGTSLSWYGTAYFFKITLCLVSIFGYFLCRSIPALDEEISILLATVAAIGCHLTIRRLDGDDVAGVATNPAGEEGPGEADGIAIRCREHNLTPRECDVVRLFATGQTLTEISQRLYISEHTAKTHLRNILAKFDVSNRSALLIKLLRGK